MRTYTRAVVAARRDMIDPENVADDEYLVVAGITPTLGCRFDETRVIGYHTFTSEQRQWWDEAFLCRMAEGSVVKI